MTANTKPAAQSHRKVGNAFASNICRAETGREKSSPRELPSRERAEAAGQDMPIKSIINPAPIGASSALNVAISSAGISKTV